MGMLFHDIRPTSPAWDSLQELVLRIKPYVNTLAQRHLYAVYDGKIMQVVMRALREDFGDYIYFMDNPAYRSSTRNWKKSLRGASSFVRETEIFEGFYTTPLESTQEEIEANAFLLYNLLTR